MLRELSRLAARAALSLVVLLAIGARASAQAPTPPPPATTVPPSAPVTPAAPTAAAPAASVAANAPAPAAPVAPSCMPACRAGYTCLQGQCVSMCNPTCAQGEKCTARGECERETAASSVPPPVVANVAPPAAGEPADPGWATGAGVFGIVAAAGTLSLAIGSEVTKEDQNPSLPLGIAATVLVAGAGPITAVGAASARKTGNVEGGQGLRITGWVAYGLTLADATLLIGMGFSEVEPPDGVIASVGALGAISLVSFSADAFFSAAEANAKRGERPPVGSLRLAPTLGWARARDGTALPVLGARGTF